MSTQSPLSRNARDVFTVSRLNRTVRELVELTLGMVWVEGEISNLSKPASGHQYFSLKDARAQVRCAFFKQRARRATVPLENGKHVRVRARASVYEPRGDYQLIVESVELAGEGALRQRYEENLRRLDEEGLFAIERKRELPSHPMHIGVVSSATGAAVRDVIEVLRRRFALADVTLYPCLVQGDQAAPAIERAIERANDHAAVDVLLIVRGGGTLEDLWAFNEERVVRAIANSQIPTVSGVGHEVDTTLSDLAADWRAPTPSAAAEIVSPPLDQLTDRLNNALRRLARLIAYRRTQARDRLGSVQARLTRQHPEHQLNTASQRLDLAQTRLQRALQSHMQSSERKLLALDARLTAQSPNRRVANNRTRVEIAATRLGHVMQVRLKQAQASFAASSRALDAVSPLATLDRGYAVVRRQADGAVLYDARDISPDERLRITLRRGEVLADARANAPDDDTPDSSST
ncbi:MAG: exodeoxyribonuclease VII large subunit [Pseudomonadota bacterium]